MSKEKKLKPITCDSPGCPQLPTHSYMVRVQCEATIYNKPYNRLVVIRCCDGHAPNGVR